MLISVVVAVRNEMQYVEECMESIFSQDYRNGYEIIVVDGMSDDGTYEFLKLLQEKKDFKLLRNEKRNAAVGRNIGIDNSKGEAIAFIDGDAVAAKNWISRIAEAMERSGAAGVGGPDLLPENSGYKAWAIGVVMTSSLARGGRLNPSTQHSLMANERYVDHIPTCNLCLSRDVLNEVGKFDESFVKGQDLELNYRIRKAGYRLLYSPEIKVVHYRKQHVHHFALQIYKWAKAKVAIIKKHGMQGMTSHIYIWPAYALLALLAGLSFCLLFNLMPLFILFSFLGGTFYSFAVLFESARIARVHHDGKLFLYSLILLPIVHVSYGYGVMVALMRRGW